LEYQNVTLSIRRDILRKAKHLAIERQTSLSGLLTRLLERLVAEEDVYNQGKARQAALMANGFDLGLQGDIDWAREELHAR
jgi:hypothetical protein